MIARATTALDIARAALVREHARILQEWAAITDARVQHAQDLSDQIAGLCEAVPGLTASSPPDPDWA